MGLKNPVLPYPNINVKKHLPFIIFLCALLIAGIHIYRNFGFPWDEIYQMDLIHQVYNYINHWDNEFLNFGFRYLGTGSELILLACWRSFPGLNEVYSRHLGVFLFFFSGLIPIYLMGLRLFKKENWALLGVILLVLSPRIFGDAFYNSKDICFMVTFSWAIFSLSYVLDKVSETWMTRIIALFFHSFLSALCISTRVAGVIMVVITAILFLGFMLINKDRLKVYIVAFFIYLVMCYGFVILFSPGSWDNPVQYLYTALTLYSHFPYDLEMLFDGQKIHALNWLWQYFPVWITITTPLLITIGFVMSQVLICYKVFRQFRPLNKTHLTLAISAYHQWIILGLWLYIPVMALFCLRSTIYDGWRQMFFIYPAIVLFTVGGLRFAYNIVIKRITKVWIANAFMAIILTAGLLEPLLFIFQYHPHENVYFSPLAGDYSSIRYRYEMDYWGLSYKQGIDAILQSDPAEHILISVAQPSGAYYVQYMLDEKNKSRINIIRDPSKADYFITEYRFHPQDYPYTNKVFSINIRGMEILAVFKIKP